MLERVVAAAMKEAPVLARMSDEAFALMREPIKAGVTRMGTEVEGTQIAGRVFATDGAKIAHFPGHSTVQESAGNIHLLSHDGAKLSISPSQVNLELLDGTIVSQEGKALTTKFPGGDILRQEKVADNHIVTTLNGRELPHGYTTKVLPDGAHLENGVKHASSVTLQDGTHIGSDTYGLQIYRGVNPASFWAGGQAPISVETRYYRSGIPHVTLHNPLEDNMFSSSFLSANAGKGISIRTGQAWKWLRDLIK